MLIAVVALTLSLWCAFETVIAPYYVWPTIAVALIGLSTTSRLRSVATLVFALLADLASNADLHAEWVWWVIVSALGVLLAASWPKARSEPCGRCLTIRRHVPATGTDQQDVTAQMQAKATIGSPFIQAVAAGVKQQWCRPLRSHSCSTAARHPRP